MKKTLGFMLSWLLILSLALAACTAEDAAEGPAGAGETAAVQERSGLAGDPGEATQEGAELDAGREFDVVTDVPFFGSQLLGYEVLGADGEPIGQVTGLVLDGHSGQIRHVLVAGEGFLGVTGDLVPVPWDALALVGFAEDLLGQDMALFLNTDAETLAAAPTTDVEALEDEVATVQWNQSVAEYWAGQGDVLPATGEDAPVLGVPILVEEGLFAGIDYDVDNFADESLGEIENFILHPNGEIRYAILEPGAVLESELIPIPWDALVWDDEEEQFWLDVDEEFLESAPGFDGEDDLDLTDPAYDAEFAAFWADFLAEPAEEEPTGDDPAEEEANIPTLAGAITGDTIVTEEGESLGTVANVVLGPEGVTQYVIVDREDEFLAVPWQAFRPVGDTDQVLFTLDPALIEEAPAIEDIDTFDPTETGWDDEVRDYWDEVVDLTSAPAVIEESDLPGFQVTDLIGAPVVGPDGEDLGELEDLAAGSEGVNRYAILNRGEDFIPVPFELFEYVEGEIRYTGDIGLLDEAPAYRSLDELNFADPAFDDPIVEYWEGQD